MKVVYLDRDGVINIDTGYVYKIEDFEFKENIFESLSYLNKSGYEIIIITNQSGIGRGLYTDSDFQKLNQWMLKQFINNGIKVLDVFYCPHIDSDNCDCRKPKAGLFKQSIEKYPINTGLSWMIGDSERDITAAITAGIKNTILLAEYTNQKKETAATKVIENICEITEIINS